MINKIKQLLIYTKFIFSVYFRKLTAYLNITNIQNMFLLNIKVINIAQFQCYIIS